MRSRRTPAVQQLPSRTVSQQCRCHGAGLLSCGAGGYNKTKARQAPEDPLGQMHLRLGSLAVFLPLNGHQTGGASNGGLSLLIFPRLILSTASNLRISLSGSPCRTWVAALALDKHQPCGRWVAQGTCVQPLLSCRRH